MSDAGGFGSECLVNGVGRMLARNPSIHLLSLCCMFIHQPYFRHEDGTLKFWDISTGKFWYSATLLH